jgi:hypothetical protein
MSYRRLALDTFEDGVADYLAANFRFPDALVGSGLILEVSRHIFVEDMPTVDELREDAERIAEEEGTGTAYDENQPTIGIYNESDPNIRATISSDSKLEFLTRFVIRFGTTPASANDLLRILYLYIVENFAGKVVGKYRIKRALPSSGPVAVEYAGDDHTFASCMIRFQAVLNSA